MDLFSRHPLPRRIFPRGRWPLQVPEYLAGWLVVVVGNDSDVAGTAEFVLLQDRPMRDIGTRSIAPKDVSIHKIEYTFWGQLYIENRGTAPFTLLEVVPVQADGEAEDVYRDFRVEREMVERWKKRRNQ